MLKGSVEVTITILFAVVALGPIIAERLRIPGLVGLIAGGTLFGPFVIDWLEADGLVSELGSIGILVLMFLAGLSFDIRAFTANRRMAITYGLLGFIIPFVLASVVMNGRPGVETLGAFLIGAMWASNTLVAYPEVQSAGLQSTRSVGAAVSAGVVADLLSLTVLAFATSTVIIEIDPESFPLGGRIAEVLAPEAVEPSTPDPALPLWAGLPLLAAICLWLLPRIGRWFFVRVGRTRPQRVVFAFCLMGLGSVVALLGGMEGLVGAFLAGLGLNRMIPTNGPLMDRLDFVGNTIFVPVFLVSIGLSIDPALLVDLETIRLGLLFTTFVLVGKTAAAVITGLLNRLDMNEIGMMSSLSFGQAASTLAIAEVGQELEMFGQDVVNAAVLAIVITAVITSLATRWFARRIPPPDVSHRPMAEELLVDSRARGSDVDQLARFVTRLAHADGGVVRPFAVATDGAVDAARNDVDRIVDAIAARGHDADGLTRVDDSFVAATIGMAAETNASGIVLDWSGPNWATDHLLGSELDGVGGAAAVPTIAAHVVSDWGRVVVVLGTPSTAWQSKDARLAARVADAARGHDHLPLTVVGGDDELLASAFPDADDDESLTIVSGDDAAEEVLAGIAADDLVVAPAHLVRSASPLRTRLLARALQTANAVVVGGPHRLSLLRSSPHRGLSAAIRPVPEA